MSRSVHFDECPAVFGLRRLRRREGGAIAVFQDDVRYRTLDTTNPKVVERLVGFEGVIDFLILLGFASDQMGLKLICEQQPAAETVKNAVDALDGLQSGSTPMGALSSARSLRRRRSPSLRVKAAQSEREEDLLTLEQIIVWSTHEATRDSETMQTLIITHRTMTDSLTMLKQLRRRFAVQLPPQIHNDHAATQKFRVHVQKSIQLKVVKALRDWMKMYWDEDFSRNLSQNGVAMQQEITKWIDHMHSQQDPRCKWLKPLADTVQNELSRNKQRDDELESTSMAMGSRTKRVHLRALGDGESIVDLLLPIAHDESIDIPRGLDLGSMASDDVADQITLMEYREYRNNSIPLE